MLLDGKDVFSEAYIEEQVCCSECYTNPAVAVFLLVQITIIRGVWKMVYITPIIEFEKYNYNK